jgi:hypothetical protein
VYAADATSATRTRGEGMARSRVVTELAKSGLILLGLVAALFIVAGAFSLLHRATCNRLDAERVSHLQPGHITRGPASIYVIGIDPGPPPSQLEAYWAAESAMDRAGCEIPGAR